MKAYRVLLYSIIMLGLTSLGISPTASIAEAQKKKAKQTTSKKSKASKSKTTSKGKATTKQSKSRNKTKQSKRSQNRRNTYRWTPKAQSRSIRTERIRLTEEDSIHFASLGVIEPLLGQNVMPLSEEMARPMRVRFMEGDTTLTRGAIESLYYGYRSKQEEYQRLAVLEEKIDAEVKASHFAKGLEIARQGLWINPLHMGLLKRACDLAHHAQDPKLDLYIWQISEILHLIGRTGKGKSYETALKVMSQDDAILYETLWLETPSKEILEKRELKSGEETYYVLSVRVPQSGETKLRYYRICNRGGA